MAATPRPRHPILLIVIDGWGIAAPGAHNAIDQAGAPHLARLAREYGATELAASGAAVGLPEGQMGNSEVGHLTLGAGRIVRQAFVRISEACRSGDLARQPVLSELLEHCRSRRKPLHFVGLLGPGGVHSHHEHLAGLVRAAAAAGVARVWVHHILDGRDTPPKSALGFARAAEEGLAAHPGARVATVSGRYWTMDRDKRWERTRRGYDLLTELEGHRAATAEAAIEAAYGRGETDEFVEPTVVGDADPVSGGDAVLVYNFRPDRVRQIVRALAEPAFGEFPTRSPKPLVATMTRYDATFESFGVRAVFPPEHPGMTLGAYYASLGLRQLRIAETEKYAHVTYFFSGGREEPFPGEERILVPSPKVATYDLQPAMGAPEITRRLLERLGAPPDDLVVLNFANPDMVGHTGRLEPTVEACRVVDECIGRLAEAALACGVLVAVTADHGNAESMLDEEGRPRTAHTTAPVPFIVAHPGLRGVRLAPGGGLANVAPTLLDLVGLPRPAPMSAPSLVVATTARP